MADYNIYRIMRLDMSGAVPIYVGMTERAYKDRWDEHILAIDSYYKNNCKGGCKGDVKNPETPYGANASKPMYNFIRTKLDGLSGQGTQWRFEQIVNADKQTEDDWIDLYISMGYKLFNMKKGEGEFITQRSPKGVDIKGCLTIEDVAMRRQVYEEEKARKAAERKQKAMERKARKDIPMFQMRYDIQAHLIKQAIDDRKGTNDQWDTLEEWVVDYLHYLELKDVKRLRESINNIENTVFQITHG